MVRSTGKAHGATHHRCPARRDPMDNEAGWPLGGLAHGRCSRHSQAGHVPSPSRSVRALHPTREPPSKGIPGAKSGEVTSRRCRRQRRVRSGRDRTRPGKHLRRPTAHPGATDGTRFPTGDPWTCITCITPAAGLIGDLAYPIPLPRWQAGPRRPEHHRMRRRPARRPGGRPQRTHTSTESASTPTPTTPARAGPSASCARTRPASTSDPTASPRSTAGSASSPTSASSRPTHRRRPASHMPRATT